MIKNRKIPHLRVLIHGRPISVDKLVYIAVISPIMTLPQLYNVLTGNADGVSVYTWATFLLVAMVWLSYGLKHKIKPIILVQSCWIVTDTVLVVALLVHK